MGLKIFEPGGIDQKSSDLTRDPRALRESLNVKYSLVKEYEKRFGTDVDPDFFGDNYSDVVFIKSLGEYFYRDGAEYWRYKNGKQDHVVQYANPSTSYNSQISGAEYLNTFIFTHQEGQTGTFKYDSMSIYRAGLPHTSYTITSQTGAAKAGFLLTFFDFIDAQGNQIFGPATIKAVTDSNITIDLDTFKDTGFYAGWINTNINKTLSNSSLADRTLTATSRSADIVVGRKIPFRTSNPGYNVSVVVSDSSGGVGDFYTAVLEIESMTDLGSGAWSIVFKEESFRGKTVQIIAAGLNSNVLCSTVLRSFFSTEETTGFVQNAANMNFVIDSKVATNSLTVITSAAKDFLLSNVYDITTSKLRPPKCKYIAAYGDQIAYGGVLSFWDFTGKESTYTNNDLVMYSDVLRGDLGENVTETNRQLIGDTYDGEITGMIRAKDSLVVFKDRAVYALDGILFPDQYAVRKIETNEIGTKSDKSLLVIDGAVLFQGQDGIYGVSGNQVKKLSTPIDKFFAQSDFDIKKTKAVMDNKNRNYYFFTNKGVAVFNFEFKEWFIWDLVNADNGLTVDNDGSIRMFKGTSAKKFIDAKNDSGVAIPAWIKTAWWDLSEPSLLKKVTDFRVFALNNQGQTLKYRVFFDWADKDLLFLAAPGDQVSKVRPGAVLPAADIDFSPASTKTVLKHVDIQQAQSISLFLGNNALNEDFRVSGFDVGLSLIQMKDKNVK